jgi:hypothetical protein
VEEREGRCRSDGDGGFMVVGSDGCWGGGKGKRMFGEVAGWRYSALGGFWIFQFTPT